MVNLRKSTILKALILLFKLNGLVPMEYDRNMHIHNKEQKLIHHSSWASFTYYLVLIGIVFMASLGAVLRDRRETWTSMETLTKLSGQEEGALLIIMWISLLMNRLKMIRALEELLQLADLLEEHHGHQTGFKNSRKRLVLIISSHIVLCITLGVSVFINGDEMLVWDYIFVFVNFVMVLFILKYSLVCLMLTNMVQSLNSMLSNFDELVSFRFVHSVTHNLDSGVENFKKIRRMHCTVWDITEGVNEIYGVSVLVIVAKIFYSIISLIESFDITISERKSLHDINYIEFILPSAHVVALWILISCTTGTISKLRQTGPLVHRKLQDLEGNSQLQEEIQRFSLEILHQRWEFTGNGFFNLDYPLLLTLIAASISYELLTPSNS